MKQFHKHIFLPLIPFVVAFFLFSCGKDDPAPLYPKSVEIEIRVSSSTSGMVAGLITYTDLGQVDVELEDQQLPFSIKLNKQVNYGDVWAVGALGDRAGNIKVELFVDGKLAETESDDSTSLPTASVSFGFL